MNVKKILKFYLVLSLAMTGVFSFGYSDIFKSYLPEYYNKLNSFSSQIFGGDEDKYLKTNAFASSLHVLDFQQKEEEKQFIQKAAKNNFNFEIVSEIQKAFAKPGEKNFKIMEYKFKTRDEKFEIKSIKLKIIGVESEKFKRFDLKNPAGQILSRGLINDAYVEFKNVNYELESNASGSLLFIVDLSDSFKTGDRFRLDLVNPADMKISVGSKTAEINSYYPVSGPYISIAKARPVAENL